MQLDVGETLIDTTLAIHYSNEVIESLSLSGGETELPKQSQATGIATQRSSSSAERMSHPAPRASRAGANVFNLN